MEERSRDLFNIFHQHSAKFDYFICGVSGALFAYIAQNSVTQKLDNVFAILQTIALLSLACSFYCGIKRIQYGNATLRYSHQMRDAEERAVYLTKVLGESPKTTSFVNPPTGLPHDRQAVEEKRQAYVKTADMAEKLGLECEKKVAHRGRLQMLFLYAGFAAIFFGRVLQPYQLHLPFAQKPPAPVKMYVH